MKRIVAVCVGLTMLGAGVTAALAQGPTIDATDVAYYFGVGKTIVYRIDTLTNSANIGAPGASAFDFSGLLTHARMSLVSVDPKGTPYAGLFPAATHALRDTAFTYSFWYEGLGAVMLKGTGFNYMTLATDLLDYGFIGTGNAYIQGQPYPAEGQWLKSPAGIYYGLPMQVGKTWTTTFDEVLSGSATLIPGWPLKVGPDTTKHTITYTVDAYGLLTVPGYPADNALRIRKEDRYSTKSAQNQLRVGYIYLAKNGASVQVTAIDASAPANGTIGVTSIQWNAPTPTDVQTVSNVPGAFQLGQNYPNPFNPSTTIRFTLPARQQVSLAVYNLLGEKVAVLVDRMVDAGESSVQFDGAGLASGVYLYKLQAGSMTQTRRMMLVK